MSIQWEPASALLDSFDAWIAPDGTFHVMDIWQHEGFAWHKHRCSADQLVKRGWIHFSAGRPNKLRGTQAQLDTLFDWARLNQRSINLKQFEVL